jgi:hypothetical protein
MIKKNQKDQKDQKGGSIIYNNFLNMNNLQITINQRRELGMRDDFLLLNVLNKLQYGDHESGFKFHSELDYTGFIYLGAYNTETHEYYSDIAINTFRTEDSFPALDILRPGTTVLRVVPREDDHIDIDGYYNNHYVYGDEIKQFIDETKMELNHGYNEDEKAKIDNINFRRRLHNWLKYSNYGNEYERDFDKFVDKIVSENGIENDYKNFEDIGKDGRFSIQPHDRLFKSYFGTSYPTFCTRLRQNNIEPLFIGVTYQSQAFTIKSGQFNNNMSDVFINTDFELTYYKKQNYASLEHYNISLIYESISKIQQKLQYNKNNENNKNNKVFINFQNIILESEFNNNQQDFYIWLYTNLSIPAETENINYNEFIQHVKTNADDNDQQYIDDNLINILINFYYAFVKQEKVDRKTKENTQLHLSEHDDILLIYESINKIQQMIEQDQDKLGQFKLFISRNNLGLSNTDLEFYIWLYTNFTIRDNYTTEPILNHDKFIKECLKIDANVKEYINKNFINILIKFYFAFIKKGFFTPKFNRFEGKSYFNNKILIDLLYELTCTSDYHDKTEYNLEDYYNNFYNDYKLHTQSGIVEISTTTSKLMNILNSEYVCETNRNSVGNTKDYNIGRTINLPKSIPFFQHTNFNNVMSIINRENGDDKYPFMRNHIYFRKSGYNISHFIKKDYDVYDDHIYYINYDTDQYIDIMFGGYNKYYNISHFEDNQSIIISHDASGNLIKLDDEILLLLFDYCYFFFEFLREQLNDNALDDLNSKLDFREFISNFDNYRNRFQFIKFYPNHMDYISLIMFINNTFNDYENDEIKQFLNDRTEDLKKLLGNIISTMLGLDYNTNITTLFGYNEYNEDEKKYYILDDQNIFYYIIGTHHGTHFYEEYIDPSGNRRRKDDSFRIRKVMKTPPQTMLLPLNALYNVLQYNIFGEFNYSLNREIISEIKLVSSKEIIYNHYLPSAEQLLYDDYGKFIRFFLENSYLDNRFKFIYYKIFNEFGEMLGSKYNRVNHYDYFLHLTNVYFENIQKSFTNEKPANSNEKPANFKIIYFTIDNKIYYYYLIMSFVFDNDNQLEIKFDLVNQYYYNLKGELINKEDEDEDGQEDGPEDGQEDDPEDDHYNKYIKYKSKYIKLNQKLKLIKLTM